MKKRISALFMSCIMIFALGACKPNKTDSDPVSSGEVQSDDPSFDVDFGSEAAVSAQESTAVTQSSGGGTTSKNTAASQPGQPSQFVPKEGDTVEKGLNFGGKTFTKTIIGEISAKKMRTIQAFEKKFNCKIELVKLKWETYNSSVATSVASGKPYDICGLSNYFFPEGVVSNLYQPLDNYITTADVYSPGKPGIDLTYSAYFNYNGKMYGASTHTGDFSSFPTVLFYNKKMMGDAGYKGNKDPLAMWKAGTWTWKTFEDMATALYDPARKKYIGGREMHGMPLYTNGGYPIKIEGGKVKENLTDSKFYKELEKMKQWYGSSTTKFSSNGFSDDPSEFFNGNHYMFMQMSQYGPLNLMPKIDSKEAFGANAKERIANLGIVPLPLGPDNTKKAVASSFLNAKASAKGAKDPRVVIAYTKFTETFDDPMKDEDPYLWDAETQKFINSLYDNLIIPIVNYKTSSTSTGALLEEIAQVAISGGNISTAITDRKGTFQSVIDESLKQK